MESAWSRACRGGSPVAGWLAKDAPSLPCSPRLLREPWRVLEILLPLGPGESKWGGHLPRPQRSRRRNCPNGNQPPGTPGGLRPTLGAIRGAPGRGSSRRLEDELDIPAPPSAARTPSPLRPDQSRIRGVHVISQGGRTRGFPCRTLHRGTVPKSPRVPRAGSLGLRAKEDLACLAEASSRGVGGAAPQMSSWRAVLPTRTLCPPPSPSSRP